MLGLADITVAHYVMLVQLQTHYLPRVLIPVPRCHTAISGTRLVMNDVIITVIVIAIVVMTTVAK